MLSGTLQPNDSLVLDDGAGFRVEFGPGTVNVNLTVTIGTVGALNPAPDPREMTIFGLMFRIGFDRYSPILKNIYVQLPWRVSGAGSKRVCFNSLKPYYPDPMPWDPADPVYRDAGNWLELAAVQPHQGGNVSATMTKRIGTMVVGDIL